MEIVPPKAQTKVESEASPGEPPTVTLEVLIHIPAGLGIQGCGVRTPSAAAVAAATAGFAMDVHIPQGHTLVNGATLLMFSAGAPPKVMGRLPISCPGLRPLVHMITAPVTTGAAISSHHPFLSFCGVSVFVFGKLILLF